MEKNAIYVVINDHWNIGINRFSFLSGYYSKDAIIEFAYLSGSNLGNVAAFIGILTAFLTSVYSWRLIFKTFHGNFNNFKVPQSKIHESDLIILIPLAALVIGSIFTGFLFKDFLIGENYADFWKKFNFINKKF